MEPERWRRVRELFEASAELDPSERDAYLTSGCGGDDELRDRVEALLRADVDGETLLDQVVGGAARSHLDASDDAPGHRLGAYRLVREIGRGGMGTVHLAVRDDDRYQQRVAIKIMRSGSLSAEDLIRFRSERQILATLDHPSIARLIDGGETADGTPYLVMEHVEGVPIDRYCEARALSIRDKLRLFRRVCAAVDHAHRMLVVHRDLKPSNILVTDAGEPKLLDFGIAKLLDPTRSPQTVAVTGTSVRLLTPGYASPEQIRGEPITTATDVYALGVVLYELLAGRRPFRLNSNSVEELERVVCGTDPDKPSAALRDDPSTAARPGLDDDLDNVVLMAIRKEPDRRYPSVQHLVADLERYERGLPVTARPDTFRYRSRKFLRRHRGKVAAATVTAIALVAATAVSTSMYIDAESARQDAETQRLTAERTTRFLQEMLASSDPVTHQSSRSLTVLEVLDDAPSRIEAELAGEPEVAATLYYTIATAQRNLGDTERAMESISRAVALWRSTSTDPESLTRALLEYGEMLAESGRIDDAEAAMNEAKTRVDTHLDATHPHAALVSRYRSIVALARGDNAEAERLARDAIERRRAVPRTETRGLIGDLNSLGLILVRRGRYADAEETMRETLALIHEAHGMEHSDAARVRANLAWVLNNQGRGEEALPHLRQVLAIYGRVFPNVNRQVASARGNLAQTLHVVGRSDEAVAEAQRAREDFARLFGDDDVNVAHMINLIAMIRESQGDTDAAVTMMQDALDIYRGRLGPEHEWVASARNNLARCALAADDDALAERECAASLEVRRKLLRPGHPDIARSAHLLARIRLRQGRSADAETLAREAVAIRVEELGPDHNLTESSEQLLRDCVAARTP